jgi:hypothetical protein
MYKMALAAFLAYVGCVDAAVNPHVSMVQTATRKTIESQYIVAFG